MKNTFKYIISVIAVGFMTAMSMSADNNDDLFVANKTVKNNGNNKYTLTLETYATGVADIITTTTRQPIDAVLVLDLSSSMILNNYTNGKTRLAAMKESCIKFINEIKKDAEDNNVDHRISIVTYGSTDPYTKVVEGLLDVTNATNVDALTNSITKLTTTNSNPYEYTRHDNGLELAEGVLKTSNSKRSQVVVLLTDGVPQTQAFTTSVFGLKIGWSKKVVEGSIATTNNLKKNGVIVFTISMHTEDSDSDTYLNHLSSNYRSDVTSSIRAYGDFMFTVSFGGTNTGKNTYFKNAASGNLDAAFSEIATQSTDNNTETTLTATNSSIRDYITPQFTLDGDASDIRVFTSKADPNNKGNEPVWLTKSEANYSVAVNTDSKTKITEVIVKGYDFTENYVGPIRNGNTITGWRGEKVIIEIDIKYNPDSDGVGGVIATNTDKSGIYSGNGQEADFNLTGIEFPVPEAVNSTAYLHITKDGLKSGESAIFTVEGSDGQEYTVIATNNESDNTTAHAYVKVKWLVNPDEAINLNNLVLDKMIKFTVKETAWTWTDKNSPTKSTNAVGLYENNGTKWVEHVFSFGHERADKSLKYDEVNKTVIAE